MSSKNSRQPSTIKRVSIIGLGLIGASLAHRIKIKCPSLIVTGISRRKSTVRKAIRKKWVDAGSTNLRDVSSSDIVFVCTPIHLILPTIANIRPFLSPHTIVVDVGSTKETITRQADRLLKGVAHFVGGHPMAGSEKSGIDWADHKLFNGANFILTPSKATSKKSLQTVKILLKRLGFSCLAIPAKRHDYLIGLISHLPYLAAITMVNLVARDKDRHILRKLAATGFKDATRKAMSPWEWGRDMLKQNHQRMIPIIEKYKRSLASLEYDIKSRKYKKIETRLKSARKFRSSMYR